MSMKETIEQRPVEDETPAAVEPQVACVIDVAFDANGMPFASIASARVQAGDHVIWAARGNSSCFRVKMSPAIPVDLPEDVVCGEAATSVSCARQAIVEVPPEAGSMPKEMPSMRLAVVRLRTDPGSRQAVEYPYELLPCDGAATTPGFAFAGKVIVRPPPRPKS